MSLRVSVGSRDHLSSWHGAPAVRSPWAPASPRLNMMWTEHRLSHFGYQERLEECSQLPWWYDEEGIDSDDEELDCGMDHVVSPVAGALWVSRMSAEAEKKLQGYSEMCWKPLLTPDLVHPFSSCRQRLQRRTVIFPSCGLVYHWCGRAEELATWASSGWMNLRIHTILASNFGSVIHDVWCRIVSFL